MLASGMLAELEVARRGSRMVVRLDARKLMKMEAFGLDVIRGKGMH